MDDVKLAVRMLPPKLTEAEFFKSIEDYTDDIDWSAWEPGYVPEEKGRPITFSVCYLHFMSAESAAEFSEKLDGSPYRDSTGGMCRCLVELAVNQRIPRSVQKGCTRADREGRRLPQVCRVARRGAAAARVCRGAARDAGARGEEGGQ